MRYRSRHAKRERRVSDESSTSEDASSAASDVEDAIIARTGKTHDPTDFSASAALDTAGSSVELPPFLRALAEDTCVLPVTYRPGRMFLGADAGLESAKVAAVLDAEFERAKGSDAEHATAGDSNDSDSDSDSPSDSDSSGVEEANDGGDTSDDGSSSSSADADGGVAGGHTLKRRRASASPRAARPPRSLRKFFVVDDLDRPVLSERTGRPLTYAASTPLRAAHKALYAHARSRAQIHRARDPAQTAQAAQGSRGARRANAAAPPAAPEDAQSVRAHETSVLKRLNALVRAHAVTAEAAAAYADAWRAAAAQPHEPLRLRILEAAGRAQTRSRVYVSQSNLIQFPTAVTVHKGIVRRTQARHVPRADRSRPRAHVSRALTHES